MKNRDAGLLDLRPVVPAAKVIENMSPQERFQNRTLRPIVKLQNDLLLLAFRDYIRKRKNTFFEMTIEQRITYIQHAIQRDMRFQSSLKGMIIGHFTLEEYQEYLNDTSALNKRIVNLVKERIISNIQLLEDGSLIPKA